MNERVLMARQPIYDREIKVVAYELLFRQYSEHEAGVIDGDAATSELLVDAFTQWDIREIVGDTRAFVNFTKALIGKPLPFDKRHLVIEVLEDVVIDDSLIRDLKRLSDDGYTIALDDFIHTEKANEILPFADIVKIDILQLSRKEIEEHLILLAPFNVQLLAEKVESYEDYEFCRNLGFEFFQGYFLCKPEIISNKKIPASKLSVLQLLQKLQNPQINMQELEQIVSGDPVLSFKILKLVNSASYNKVAKIESIRQSISYLGIDRLRSLTTLLSLSGLSDKPSALRDYSCTRARLCELIGQKISPHDAASYFSVGLLSMLEAYFDKTMQELVEVLALHEDIEAALVGKEGSYGSVLNVVARLQEADFAKIDWQFLSRHNITPDCLNTMNQESMQWYRDLSTV
jgi:EAL and modified HD-GYP domain-containing signal transduction protein